MRLKWMYLRGGLLNVLEAQKVFLEVLGTKNPDLEDWQDFEGSQDFEEAGEVQIHLDPYFVHGPEKVIELLRELKEKGLLLRLERGGLIFNPFRPEVEQEVVKWARENGLTVI